jgi:hypothetical protein
VEEVCEGYETLELDISEGGGETTLAEAIYGWILWEMHHIILKLVDQALRPASPGNMSPPSPPATPQYSPSPSSLGQPLSPTSPPPRQPVSPFTSSTTGKEVKATSKEVQRSNHQLKNR